jgi:hypothetical protein
MLHQGERRTLTTKPVRETEAEAVAFLGCQAVGLDNGTSAQDYVVFAVMLCRLRMGALLLGSCPTEHNISKAAALPGPVEFARGQNAYPSSIVSGGMSSIFFINTP